MQLVCLELEELAKQAKNIQCLTKALGTALDVALEKKNVAIAREYMGAFYVLEGAFGDLAEQLNELAH